MQLNVFTLREKGDFYVKVLNELVVVSFRTTINNHLDFGLHTPRISGST